MRSICFLILLLSTSLAFAQHNNRSARDLQFRFGNPGARSLGFGGAFLALADDATAPVANPAGMLRTSKRSAALEVNYQGRDNVIPFQSGNIVQTNLFEFDFNLNESDAKSETFQVPYLAVVFPQEQWRFAFFAHQQANIERSYRTESIVVCPIGSQFHPNCQNASSPQRFFPSADVLSLDMINVGGSIAYGFGDNFSLGLSLFYSDLDYRADSVIEFEQIAGLVPVNKFARGDDTAIGGFVGMLWRLTPELSVGATYKRQPEFVYTASLDYGVDIPNTPERFQRDADFKIPDSLGIGVSVNPVEQLTINLDVNRVYYSQVTDDLVDFALVDDDRDAFITQTMADVTEIHLGMEWVFLGAATPISLRLGYWLDPYHAATNNIDDNQILRGTTEQTQLRDIFFLNRFAEDENHYALGLGWTLGQNFQLDAAVDIGDRGEDATLSGIYRF